jgi:hypothetical protein
MSGPLARLRGPSRRAVRLGVAARRILGLVRLVNGTVALLAPQVLLKQLGTDAASSPAGVYAFRLFGIRTVLIGLDLLHEHDGLDQAVRRAPLVHASDTTTAALLATRGALPRRAGIMVTAISAVNTVLALLARAGRR